MEAVANAAVIMDILLIGPSLVNTVNDKTLAFLWISVKSQKFSVLILKLNLF